MNALMKHFRALLPVAAALLVPTVCVQAARAAADAPPAAAAQATQPAGAEKPAQATTPGPAAKATDAAPADASGKIPKATVITLGERGGKDEVGIYLTEQQLKQVYPMLLEDLGDDGSGVVVFRVTSGGGLGLEVQRISDEIQNVYKKHFRVVAWIDSAISAAAMSSHCIEEIYFTPQGNYGACTGWHGALIAAKGRDLEDMLYQMEKISARGGYDPQIMKSMQVMQPLSCTVEDSGQVKFYPDTNSGNILLNPEGRILTLTADTALKIHFSRGTAEDLDQLTKLMGYKELNWIGERKKGFIWPISRAEKWSMDYRDKVFQAENLFNADAANYRQQIAAAEQAANRKERGVFVNRALGTLRKLKRSVEENPNFALMQFNMTPDQFMEWYKEQERALKDMMK